MGEDGVSIRQDSETGIDFPNRYLEAVACVALLQRQRRPAFQRAERDPGPEAADVRILVHQALHEHVVILDIAGGDDQNEVAVAGDVPRLLNSAFTRDPALELSEQFRPLTLDLDVHDHAEGKAHGLRVKDGHFGGDDAGLTQPSDAPLHGRRRKTDLCTDPFGRKASILLHQAKQHAIDAVEFVRHSCVFSRSCASVFETADKLQENPPSAICMLEAGRDKGEPSARMTRITRDEIDEARRRIDPVFLDSPLAGHAQLDAALGCRLAIKVETLNPVRSFKGRGTEAFAALALAPGERCVTASAGNFGQGLARAVLGRGGNCTVFAATTANPAKVETLRLMGAEVHLHGSDFDAAKDAARLYAADRGLRFVEDGAERTIAAGAGTMGVELAERLGELDAVVVPLGNGALLAGVGAAMRALAPRTEIIAVVAEGAPSMKLSLEAGRVVETEAAHTIADGIAVRRPVPEAFPMLTGCFDAVMAVSDDDIRAAMRLTAVHLGLIAEPSGAAGIAAILAAPDRFRDRRAATILTGGNIAPADLARLVADAET